MVKRKKKIKKMKVKTKKADKGTNKKTKTETKGKKADKKQEIASILVYLAIVWLIFNAIYAFILRTDVASQLDEQSLQELEDMEVTIQDVQTTMLAISIIWLVLGITMFFLKRGIDKRKVGWGWLLSVSILVFLFGFISTIVPALLGVIASILYATRKK